MAQVNMIPDKANHQDMQVPFLGSIPIDPRIARACDEGKFYMDEFPDSEATKAFDGVIKGDFWNR